MPALFSKLKSQLESNRSIASSNIGKKIKLSDKDIAKDKILRPDLIDTDVYDIYKDIPLDPQEFYEDMGCIILHPKTGERIRKLADYQIEFWKSCLPKPVGMGYNYALCIKSNKIGLTTSELYGDFQSLIKIAPGKQVLIVAQTQEMANDHLYTLKRDILSSEKYSKFLITHSIEGLSKEEQSKVKTLFIRNPLNKYKPARIIALGPQESGSVSWKEAYRIHISDITKSRIDYDRTIAGLFTRPANTQGVIKIETVPAQPKGWVYERAVDSPSNFFFRTYNYEYGVKAGIMSLQFIEDQKESLKNLFDNFYDCKFGSTAIGNVFDPSYIDKSLVDDKINLDEEAVKSWGIDPAFGSSNYGLTIIQFIDGFLEVVYSDELTRPSHDEVRDFLFSKYEECQRVDSINVDASFPSEIAMIKKDIVHEEYRQDIYKQCISECRKYGTDPSHRMKVIPHAFGQGGGINLLQHAKQLLEDDRQLVKINEQQCPKLVTALRSATAENMRLDKENTSYDDVLDSFILALSFFKFK